MKGSVTLCENAGAGNQADKQWMGGRTALVANGTFGGGSCKLQMKVDIGGTAAYFDVPSGSLSAIGYLIVELPPGTYRAVTATGSGFYAKLVSVPNS